MKTRLFITSFGTDNGTSGISAYTKEICKNFMRDEQLDTFVFASRSNYDWVSTWCERDRIILINTVFENTLMNIFWHFFLLPIHLLVRGADVIFFPAANRRIALTPRIHSVGTIHDFSQLHVSEKYDGFRMLYVLHLLPFIMRKLDQIITVSNAARIDISQFLRIQEERIVTIYNGVNRSKYLTTSKHESREVINGRYALNAPFILFTSRIEHPGKNHVGLIEAYAALKARHDIPHKLVFVGKRWDGALAVDQLIAAKNLQNDIIVTDFVEDDILAHFYAAADLFVFPSFYEGFGIPVVEAMANKIPTCASNVASIPEVLGDCGLLFDPNSIDEMSDAIFTLIYDNVLCEELTERGLERAKLFSWKTASRETLNVIISTPAQSHRLAGAQS